MAPRKKPKNPTDLISKKVILHPVWLTISEAAKMAGVNNKTIRRAIQEQVIKYKIVGDRYYLDFSSLLKFSHSRIKLINKLNEFGLGQYVDKWREENSSLNNISDTAEREVLSDSLEAGEN